MDGLEYFAAFLDKYNIARVMQREDNTFWAVVV